LSNANTTENRIWIEKVRAGMYFLLHWWHLLIYEIYDKRNYFFNFPIVNFSFIYSNTQTALQLNYISLSLVWYSTTCVPIRISQFNGMEVINIVTKLWIILWKGHHFYSGTWIERTEIASFPFFFFRNPCRKYPSFI
jgi:hypothetical protein